jgi:hypothetical protein
MEQRKPKYGLEPDDNGTGWHVVITRPNGRVERRDGFVSDSEAHDWIVANSGTKVEK